MALAYPLTLANFFDLLPISSAPFTLGEAREGSETQGGEFLDASFGARLWQTTITVRANTYLDADSLVARAELLLDAGASFYMYPRHRAAPQADPTGSILGAATPALASVAGNMVDVNISGLPAGYVLTRGDFLCFPYLSSPTRRALHRVVTTATANGSGVISAMQVTPSIRPGVTGTPSIDLLKPFCKAKIIQNTFEPPSHARAPITSFSFRAQQTLR